LSLFSITFHQFLFFFVFFSGLLASLTGDNLDDTTAQSSYNISCRFDSNLGDLSCRIDDCTDHSHASDCEVNYRLLTSVD
jgi:hypothetical protein